VHFNFCRFQFSNMGGGIEQPRLNTPLQRPTLLRNPVRVLRQSHRGFHITFRRGRDQILQV
jgi:hypothetical protein